MPLGVPRRLDAVGFNRVRRRARCSPRRTAWSTFRPTPSWGHADAASPCAARRRVAPTSRTSPTRGGTRSGAAPAVQDLVGDHGRRTPHTRRRCAGCAATRCSTSPSQRARGRLGARALGRGGSLPLYEPPARARARGGRRRALLLRAARARGPRCPLLSRRATTGLRSPRRIRRARRGRTLYDSLSSARTTRPARPRWRSPTAIVAALRLPRPAARALRRRRLPHRVWRGHVR